MTYLASVHDDKGLPFGLYTIVRSDDKCTLYTLLSRRFRNQYRELVVPTLISDIFLTELRDEELVEQLSGLIGCKA